MTRIRRFARAAWDSVVTGKGVTSIAPHSGCSMGRRERRRMANAVPTVLVVLIAATSCLADPKLPEPKKGVIVKSNGHVFINNSAVAADCFVVSVDLGILEPAIFQYAFEFFLQALPGGAEVAGKPVSGVLQNIANEFSTIYVFEKPDGTPVKIAPGGRVRVNAVIDEKGANKFRWGSNAKFCRIIPGEDDPQELPTIRAKVLVLKAKDGNSTDYILFNQGETSQETHIEQLAFAFGPVSTDLEKLGDIEELGEVQHFFGPGNEGWVINGDPFGDPDDFFDDLSMIAVNVPGSIPSGEALIIEGHGTNLTTGEPVFFRQLHEVVPGACCRPDGVCVSVTGDECNKVGGDFFGAGSECAGSVAAAVIQDPFDGPCLEWQHSINDSVESLEAGFNEGKYVISELAPIDGARSFPVQRLRRELIAPNKYAAELTMEWAEANDGDPNQAFVSEIVVKDTNDFTLGWVGLNDTSEPA